MIVFDQERFSDVVADLPPLLEKHWQEIALNQDKIKLNPDWPRYESLDLSGNLAIFTVRDDGKLIGYFVLFIMPHIHYSDHIFAVNDILFIDPEYRRGSMAIRFFKFAEEELKKRGTSVIVINSKVHAPFGKILERIGYSFAERIYTKAVI